MAGCSGRGRHHTVNNQNSKLVSPQAKEAKVIRTPESQLRAMSRLWTALDLTYILDVHAIEIGRLIWA